MKLIIESINALMKILFILSAAPIMLIGFALGYLYQALAVGFFFGKLYLNNLTEPTNKKG